MSLCLYGERSWDRGPDSMEAWIAGSSPGNDDVEMVAASRPHSSSPWRPLSFLARRGFGAAGDVSEAPPVAVAVGALIVFFTGDVLSLGPGMPVLAAPDSGAIMQFMVRLLQTFYFCGLAMFAFVGFRFMQEILRGLVSTGARLSRFEIVAPSLHKIFVDLVGPEAAHPDARPEGVARG